MIHFDGSKLAEAFSNGGIYVHSDPYLGYRFVDGKIAEDVFTIDYLAPVEFRQDRETGTISFENIVDPEFGGWYMSCPKEQTHSKITELTDHLDTQTTRLQSCSICHMGKNTTLTRCKMVTVNRLWDNSPNWVIVLLPRMGFPY